MISRFITVAPDGETILAVLHMTDVDAALNAPAGGSVVSLSDDTGAHIDDATMQLVGGQIVDVVSGDPIPTLADVTLSVLE
jgi:hypothetical protein